MTFVFLVFAVIVGVVAWHRRESVLDVAVVVIVLGFITLMIVNNIDGPQVS